MALRPSPYSFSITPPTIGDANFAADAQTVWGELPAAFVYIEEANDWNASFAVPLAGGTMTGSLGFGTNRARFGANELDIYIAGTIALITAEIGDVWLRNTFTDGVVQIQTDNGSGGNANYITCDGAVGEVQLKHYGIEKLATKATGINVTGTLTTTQASAAAHVLNRTGTDGTISDFKNDGTTVGTISVTGAATAYNTSSDYRLKENIVPIQGASDIVKSMKPCTYNFKADGSWADGFIAHEMQELHPQAVTGTKDGMRDEEYQVSPALGVVFTAAVEEVSEIIHSVDVERPATLENGQRWRETTAAVTATRSVPDYQGVDYSKLTPILTAALKEALDKIDDLQTRLAALEAV